MAPVPPFEGFLGKHGEVLFVFSGWDHAPRRGVIEHEADVLGRFRKRRVYRRGERVDEIRIARRVEPQEAPAIPAEVPLRLACRYLVWASTVVELRVVDGEVLTALYF